MYGYAQTSVDDSTKPSQMSGHPMSTQIGIPQLIDESLLSLDRVINALVDNSANGYWGGTKLTRLLHDFPRRRGEDVHLC